MLMAVLTVMYAWKCVLAFSNLTLRGNLLSVKLMGFFLPCIKIFIFSHFKKCYLFCVCVSNFLLSALLICLPYHLPLLKCSLPELQEVYSVTD